jgi:hypothetical protein
VPERLPWFWIKIGRLWILMRAYEPAEMAQKKRTEALGFIAARVLGPGETRQAVLDEVTRRMHSV